MFRSAERNFWSHFDNRGETWRDGGPDSAALAAMSPDEKHRVEEKLLKRLADHPDSDEWVIMALGEIKSAAAESSLRALVARGLSTSVNVAAAHAVWRIAGDPSMVVELARILHTRPAVQPNVDGPRIEAAVALGGIDTADSRAALEKATTDPDYLVRYNAASALRRLNTQPGIP